jgi:hypothetical protein
MPDLVNPPPPEQLANMPQGNALMSGAQPTPSPQMGGNALASGAMSSPQPGQPGAQPMPAPPTHAQTVAALRHFDAIKGALAPLLQDPALGKSNMKMPIIDAVTKLVSERIISAATAVDQLSKVPSDPSLQRKALQNMMQQAMQAENGVLDHYGQGNPSLGEVAQHFAANKGGSRDDHMEHMKALNANYSGGQ